MNQRMTTFAELARETNGELYTWVDNMVGDPPTPRDIELVGYTVRPELNPDAVEVKFPGRPSLPLQNLDRIEEPAVLVNQPEVPKKAKK